MENRSIDEIGIAVFGFDRSQLIYNTLQSLKMQNAIQYVHVWIDGDQGNPKIREKTQAVYEVANAFSVKKIHRHRGNLGFRKMMLQALEFMGQNYDRIIILEDDCFPTRDAVEIFKEELDIIAVEPDIFSTYGHHFLVPAEGKTIGRFQGWGWATTSHKLMPVLEDLTKCFLMSEEQYLKFTQNAMSEKVLQIIDVTPGRQPSATLKAFFAWDETVCLICAIKGLKHRKTRKRIIYNCGVGKNSTHFSKVDYYRKPPFNMISPEEVWTVFDHNGYQTIQQEKFYYRLMKPIRQLFGIR